MKHVEDEYTLEHLVELLDLVVREQVGESLADTMQRIRRLAMERRAGLPDAESRLVNQIQRLEPQEMRAVIRWLSVFFDLANIAEERQRIDVLKSREEKARNQGIPRRESIRSAVHDLHSQGLSAADMQRWLDKLMIEPVFTAHPSEAKRRTTRELLRKIRKLLEDANNGGFSQIEAIESEILANLTILWQSDFVRPDRPPVMSEVSRGVYFASTLWNVVPKTYRELRNTLDTVYPQHHFEIPNFMRFGTWIGGDRDGHPFVTAEVTRETFKRLRRAALEGHLEECSKMHNVLITSDQQIHSDQVLRDRIDECLNLWPAMKERLERVSISETYRRFNRMLEFRLKQSLVALTKDDYPDGAYNSVDEFRQDLELLKESLLQNRGHRAFDQYLQSWIDITDTFGFHFASLDIRQNSAVHRNCLQEIAAMQLGSTEIPSDNLLSNLISKNDLPNRIQIEKLSPESREVFDTFMLLAEKYESWGQQIIGCYIISMTHSEDDVLTVLWLWRTAWIQTHDDESQLPCMPIVPLFETIDDLRRASDIFTAMLAKPAYQQYLNRFPQLHQIVMIGYSDSTKDGGYLTACWELHQGQRSLGEIAEQAHIDLTVFHGRGGALGRGGGPAARAIISLPPKSVGGRLRVTEQGEVLSERYDDPAIAHRHLEQIINATLLVSAGKRTEPDPQWDVAMDKLSGESFAKYRQLVEHPGFLNYFASATPISEIETLPIGSRPARRGQRRELSDLRAIPWTFAWTQSRHILPAWFGLGTSIRKFVDEQDSDWALLRTMYKSWPMFRALIDNAELALAKSDMQIAHSYAALTENGSSDEVWEMISSEFESSRAAILMIKEINELLAGIQWLKDSVRARNPYVDPLNLSQIHLLRQLREDDPQEELLDLVRLSIQGVAAGLRTTG